MVLSVNPHNALISLSLSRIPRRSWRIQITLKGEEWGERPPEQPPTPPTPVRSLEALERTPTLPLAVPGCRAASGLVAPLPHHSIQLSCKDKTLGPNLVLRAIRRTILGGVLPRPPNPPPMKSRRTFYPPESHTFWIIQQDQEKASKQTKRA